MEPPLSLTGRSGSSANPSGDSLVREASVKSMDPAFIQREEKLRKKTTGIDRSATELQAMESTDAIFLGKMFNCLFAQ